jgi:glycosyltransferase involved in cell wall biosynthesis
MKISQVMLSKGFGGAERLFVDLCRALADDGHQVQAVCHPDFDAVSQLEYDRISIAPLRVKWDWSPWARGRLGRILGDFSPQVIHSHLCRGSAVAGDAGAKAGIPVIANMHNYANLKYYRNISHFCPGTADQKRYLMGGGVKEKNISVVPHFSMIPVAEKETAASGDESPVLVSFGRFVHKKGFHILIDAIKLLGDSGLDIKLVIGGDGPEREKLRNQVETLKLRNHISFHGWVEDVSFFLSQGRYFVLPSLDEPFGIVILEAMARGKVILASRSEGPKEILDSSTAWMFELNDPVSLAEAVRQAILNPGSSTEKARASLEKYRSTYSPERIIPVYVALYHELVSLFYERTIRKGNLSLRGWPGP